MSFSFYFLDVCLVNREKRLIHGGGKMSVCFTNFLVIIPA